MTSDQPPGRAGAACDELDEILSRLEPAQTIAVSHLYVARDLLLTHVEHRPHQTAPTAVAELSAVAAALERASDNLPGADYQRARSDIDQLLTQIRGLRQALGETEAVPLGWNLENTTREWVEES